MPTTPDFLRALEALAATAPTYRTGGTGADGTCDCIGATMGALYALGRARYPLHSSNYFARFEVDDLRPLTSASDCFLGMQVFKARADAPLNARYLSGGRYFTGDLLDYYHAGVVTRVNPLEILHCTSRAGANGFVRDGRLGKWTHGGRIRGVTPETDGGGGAGGADGADEALAPANGGAGSAPANGGASLASDHGGAGFASAGSAAPDASSASTPAHGGASLASAGSAAPDASSASTPANGGAGSAPANGGASPAPADSAAPANVLAAYVYAPTGSTVNLRAKPSRRAMRLARVPIGARVEVLRRGERWCRIRHEGRKGWMMSQYLCSSLPPEVAP